jgi:hypothetical protein
LGFNRLSSTAVLKVIVQRTVTVVLSCFALWLLMAEPAGAAPAPPAPVELSFAGQDVSQPRVAIDSQGEAVVAWVQAHRNEEPSGSSGCCWDYDLQSAIGSVLSGVWQTPVYVSPPGQSYISTVAVDPQGRTVVVWESSVEAPTTERLSTVQAAAGSAVGGAWQTPVELSGISQKNPQPTTPGLLAVPAQDVRLEGDFQPQVALDSQGDAIAAWTHYTRSGSTIQAAVRLGAGGAWQAPVNLSAENESPRRTSH